MKKIYIYAVCLLMVFIPFALAAKEETKPANKVTLNTNKTVGKVDPNIYGGFIEHLGRVVYKSIYNPAHPKADKNGLRQDTISVLKEMHMPIYRWPGGSMASGYHWIDGIGPKDKRPTKFEMHWRAIEPHQFGIDEFMIFLDQVGSDALITVNLGTGTEEMAAAFVEYCNSKPGTYYADLRVKNGHPEPYNVRYWCLGNEMTYPGQLGRLSAEDYAKKAARAAQMMLKVDPTIKLVNSLTCKQIDSVLDIPGIAEATDFISVHHYTSNDRSNDKKYLAAGTRVESFIRSGRESAEKVLKAGRPKVMPRRLEGVYLCFDEWATRLVPEWSKRSPDGKSHTGEFAPAIGEWPIHTIDAMVNAQYLNAFIRNADIVKMATYSTALNWFAPVIVEEDAILKQVFFYIFQTYSQCGYGISLNPEVMSETYSVDSMKIPYIDVSACYSEKEQTVRVFLINRDLESKQYVALNVEDKKQIEITRVMTIGGTEAYAKNSFDKPNSVLPKELNIANVRPENLELAPLSFTYVELKVNN